MTYQVNLAFVETKIVLKFPDTLTGISFYRCCLTGWCSSNYCFHESCHIAPGILCLGSGLPTLGRIYMIEAMKQRFTRLIHEDNKFVVFSRLGMQLFTGMWSDFFEMYKILMGFDRVDRGLMFPVYGVQEPWGHNFKTKITNFSLSWDGEYLILSIQEFCGVYFKSQRSRVFNRQGERRYAGQEFYKRVVDQNMPPGWWLKQIH